MKRTRIMGLCLVAVCAVFAFAATSAFRDHNLPHFGKCTVPKALAYTRTPAVRTRRQKKPRMGTARQRNREIHQRETGWIRPGGS